MSKVNKLNEFRELVAFTVLFYIIPIFMLSMGYIPFEARHVVLVIMGLILVAYAISKHIGARKLGFRVDNLKESLKRSILISLVIMAAMFVMYALGILESINYEGSFAFLVFYVFISVPIQEFVFRSLMIYEINVFTKNKYALIGISTLAYSLSHVMYHSWQVIGVTMVMGIIWGLMYLKWPNFWGVFLSHALIGVAAVFVGVV
jgi:membrane protease YdiL (CAAX protease family)